MPERPTGTATFLFTNIEGSTALAQAHLAEWRAPRSRHHAILQSACDALSAALDAAWAAGRTLTLEQAVALAMEER